MNIFFGFCFGGEEGEGAEGPQQGPKGPPALRSSEKEGGLRPPEPSRIFYNNAQLIPEA